MHIPTGRSAALITLVLVMSVGLGLSPSHGFMPQTPSSQTETAQDDTTQDDTTEDADEQDISGVLPPTDTFVALSIGLCESECIQEGTYPLTVSTVEEDGFFRLTHIPVESTPRLSVYYTTYRYTRDGERFEAREEGYLGWVDEELRVVDGFDDAATWPVVEDLGELTVVVPEPKKWVKARVTSVSGSIVGPYVTLTYRATKVQKGTRILAVAYGCGGEAVARTRVRGKSGRFRFFVDTTLDEVARYVPVKITVRKKGRLPSNSTSNWGPMQDRPKKC